MSDLISRKAAIDKMMSLKRERVNPLTVKEKAMNYILEVAASCLYYLPSAKQEECKYWDNESHYCELNRPSAQPNLQPTCNHLATDCISRQAAIEAIEDTDWYHINRRGELVQGANSEEHIPLYKAGDIYKVLDSVPSAQQEQRWIPVSERLPEKGQTCLVCDEGVIAIDKYLGIGNSLNWDWYDRDYDAWMPLPEPYKEERG